MIRPGWLPPVSPYCLIQETLWPDEWCILVACLLLNCTTRKQVDRVLPEFRRRWPTPQLFLSAPVAAITALIKPLGFSNRRAATLFGMTQAYLHSPWVHAQELPGVGDYAGRSWEIFCRGELGDDPPKDHALTAYWCWLTRSGNDAVVLQEGADDVGADEEADVRHVAADAVGGADEVAVVVEGGPAGVAEEDGG